jgi:hypothetical protein
VADQGVARLRQKVEQQSAREKELRELLLDAHDRLMRRDEELQIASRRRTAEPPAPAAAKALPGERNGENPRRFNKDRYTRLTFLEYQQLISRIRDTVPGKTPKGATILVISRGDKRLLQFEERVGWHFPQTDRGVYAGHHPANDDEAIAHMEELRAHGGGFLLIPCTALWWLDYYVGFRQHLENHHRLIHCDEACVLFELDGPPTPVVDGRSGVTAAADKADVPRARLSLLQRVLHPLGRTR